MKMGNHGPHHTCMMCGVAKATGMMEKHPENCNCTEAQKEKEEKTKKENS